MKPQPNELPDLTLTDEIFTKSQTHHERPKDATAAAETKLQLKEQEEVEDNG